MPNNTDIHRRKIETAQSGTARAALLGVSDGLVTNVSLILGVAAAGASAGLVRVAGIASLIAGACSMAVGEYISMRGQVELLESVLEIEREELRSNPKPPTKPLKTSSLMMAFPKKLPTPPAWKSAKTPKKPWPYTPGANLALTPANWAPPGVLPGHPLSPSRSARSSP